MGKVIHRTTPLGPITLIHSIKDPIKSSPRGKLKLVSDVARLEPGDSEAYRLKILKDANNCPDLYCAGCRQEPRTVTIVTSSLVQCLQCGFYISLKNGNSLAFVK